MKERRMSIGGLLIGLFVGFLIGSGVAMFATPRSGTETRQLVREKSAELKEKAGEAIGKARLQTGEFINNARQNVAQRLRRDTEEA